MAHSIPTPPPAEDTHPQAQHVQKPTRRTSLLKAARQAHRASKRVSPVSPIAGALVAAAAPTTSTHGSTHTSVSVVPLDQKNKRVWKACERCRMKKTKCDGEFPCKRCKDDGLVCTAGVRKRMEYKQLPRGYAEVLESTQYTLIATIHKLYAMVRNGESWDLGEPDTNDRGLPVVHHIADKLGCIRPNSDIDLPVHSVFPENETDMKELVRQLEEQQQQRQASGPATNPPASKTHSQSSYRERLPAKQLYPPSPQTATTNASPSPLLSVASDCDHSDDDDTTTRTSLSSTASASSSPSSAPSTLPFSMSIPVLQQQQRQQQQQQSLSAFSPLSIPFKDLDYDALLGPALDDDQISLFSPLDLASFPSWPSTTTPAAITTAITVPPTSVPDFFPPALLPNSISPSTNPLAVSAAASCTPFPLGGPATHANADTAAAGATAIAPTVPILASDDGSSFSRSCSAAAPTAQDVLMHLDEDPMVCSGYDLNMCM